MRALGDDDMHLSSSIIVPLVVTRPNELLTPILTTTGARFFSPARTGLLEQMFTKTNRYTSGLCSNYMSVLVYFIVAFFIIAPLDIALKSSSSALFAVMLAGRCA